MIKGMYEFKLYQKIAKKDPDTLQRLRNYSRQEYVSINDHFSWQHRQLAEKLRRKRSIYLDLKYWILFRDVDLGNSNNVSHQHMVRLLRALVLEGIVFCPASSSTLLECQKIKDERRRTQTADLVDQFSLGIGFRHIRDRIKLEFFSSWDTFKRTENKLRTSSPIDWTSIALAHGVPLGPPPSSLPEDLAIASGKLIVDELMELSFSDTIRFTHSDELDRALLSNSAASEINADRKSDATMRRFSSEFPHECIDLIFSNILVENNLIEEATYHASSSQGRVLSVRSKEVIEFITRILIDVCKNRNARQCPTMYLWSGLHSKGKEAKASYSLNDIFDYDHACAAVPYCDAFFTERRLSTWLNQNPISVNDHFECFVSANDDEIIAHLESY